MFGRPDNLMKSGVDLIIFNIFCEKEELFFFFEVLTRTRRTYWINIFR
jgi:hypothetical protein